MATRVYYSPATRRLPIFRRLHRSLRAMGAVPTLSSLPPKPGTIFHWAPALLPEHHREGMNMFAVSFSNNSWTLRSLREGEMTESVHACYGDLEKALKSLIRPGVSPEAPGEKRTLQAFTPALFKSYVEGKSVAVVGNAGYMAGAGNGAAIDACDFIIRLSYAAGAQLLPEDHGSHTHLWCLNSSAYRKILSGALRYPPDDAPILYVRGFGTYSPPEHYPVFPHPVTGIPARTHAVLGSILVHQALLGGAREVFATGMDFFRTGDPFVGKIGEAALFRFHASGTVCHHFPTDERFMRHLREEYPDRLKTDPYLGEILDGKHPRE